MRSLTLTFLILVVASQAKASQIEAVGASYDDENRTTQIMGVRGEYIHAPRRSFFRKRPLSLGIGYTKRDIGFKDETSFVVEDQLEGQQEITQNDVSFSLSQNISLTTDVSVFAAISDSPLLNSKTFGIAGSRWVRKDTLKLGISLSQNDTEQATGDIYDTDQRRVRLPSELSGQNISGNFMHYTSPVLITLGTFSYTQRTDRPDAHAQTLGIKRFLKSTHSSLHLEAGHFTNVGELKEQSLFGSVQAYSLRGEWHQKVMRTIQAMAGYRFYNENVEARNNFENTTNLASDTLYAMVKYRFGHRRWLEEAHEFQTFVQQYSTNEPRTAILLGMGVKAQLN